MEYSLFVTLFSFLVLFLHKSDNSLLSRYKNKNEYISRDVDYGTLLPEELDDFTYQDLVQEIPELKKVLQEHRRNKNKRNEDISSQLSEAEEEWAEDDHDYKYDKKNHEDMPGFSTERQAGTSYFYNNIIQAADRYYYNATLPTSTERMRFQTRWPTPNSTNTKILRSEWTGTRVASCYRCGIHSDWIPRSPLCHDAFESPDWRFRTLSRYFRAICFENANFSGSRIQEKTIYNKHYMWDRGLKREFYGPYYGGCYKRYLDVGQVYTVRGCRRFWPESTVGNNFANHRFRRLEALIRKEKDACISSPHASLTPFHRGISLFVRYHVCVCNTKWCNAAGRCDVSFVLILVIFAVLYIVY